ncbi:hypothetical protein NZK33_18225 [Cyanobium sp. FGCU-6]|nr:hypothetical protein [Cyanobium sp. FGCU6]
MRARDAFAQAQLRLQAAGCRYRIKEVARSPYVQVYETHPPRRQQSARGYRCDDDDDCWDLVELLLRADQSAAQGRPGLDWEALNLAARHGDQPHRLLTWGELRATVQGWIAPGGPKARDRNPFVCFREGGYFGRAIEADQVATTRQLEDYCQYTSASLLAHRHDPGQQLIRREYNSKGFYGVIQMVNYLAQRGVAIATPELQGRLDRLKKSAGKLQAPAPRFIPRTEDIQSWLDQLQPIDPLRGWVMAMIATFGLRGHEVWHIDRLPGEVSADPGVIEVGSFKSHGDGSETKTGHRFALPLPAEWVIRYRLDDLEHSRRMLADLRRRHPVKTIERGDGTVQFFNSSELAIVLAHWLRNRGREDREIAVKLFGYHQPRQLPGKPKPRAKRDRCKLYDLRHAWALRAKATTTWSTAVKAASMGHCEAVHASRYLAEEQAEHQLTHLLRRRDLDEGRLAEPLPAKPSAAAQPKVVTALPQGVTPELIDLARKLRAAGVA